MKANNDEAKFQLKNNTNRIKEMLDKLEEHDYNIKKMNGDKAS